MDTLYKIAENYQALLNMDLDEETLADTLESIEGEFEEKADNICHVIAEVGGKVDIIDAEIKRLQARKKTLSGRKDSLRNYLLTQMEVIDKKKLETPKFTITRVLGRDTCLIENESVIPQMFQKTTISIDRALLLQHLKDGESIDGAVIGTGASSLRIK